MQKNNTHRRMLSAAISAAMILGIVPGQVLADETPMKECHPVHDVACGYSEGTAGNPCTYVATEGAEEAEHIHNEACGYVEATPATPCEHSCEICAPEEETSDEQTENQEACANLEASSALLDSLLEKQNDRQSQIEAAAPPSDIDSLTNEIDALWAHVESCTYCKEQLEEGGAFNSKFYGVEPLVENVCEIPGGNSYSSLNDAFSYANSYATVKLLTDVNNITSPISFAGKYITLDLNGKTISVSPGNINNVNSIFNITNGGQLKVKDSQGAGGNITSNADNLNIFWLQDTSSLEITGGTIRGKSSCVNGQNNATGTVEVTGGSIITSATADDRAAINTVSLEMTGGLVKSENTTASAVALTGETSTANISGGTIDGQILLGGYRSATVANPYIKSTQDITVTLGKKNSTNSLLKTSADNAISVQGNLTLNLSDNGVLISPATITSTATGTAAVIYATGTISINGVKGKAGTITVENNETTGKKLFSSTPTLGKGFAITAGGYDENSVTISREAGSDTDSTPTPTPPPSAPSGGSSESSPTPANPKLNHSVGKNFEFSDVLLNHLVGNGTLKSGGALASSPVAGNVSTAAAAKATISAVESAMKQAAVKGVDKAEAKVTFSNLGTLTESVVDSVLSAAQTAGKGKEISVVVNADTVDNNGMVLARMSIDVEKAAKNGEAINTAIDVNAASKTNMLVKEYLDKFYNNQIITLAFGHKGDFGMDVPVAVKRDLSGLDTKNLYFYAYDTAENSYVQIQTAYFIDDNQYLHFTTNVGNSILITDAPLGSKIKKQKVKL